MGEDKIENPPCQTGAWRAQLFTRGFGDTAILHSRRTSRFAGAAEETEINMFFEPFVELDPSVGGGFDEVNTSARRLRFESQNLISGALIQTEPAVNALIELGEIECGNLRRRHILVYGRRVPSLEAPVN